jgi:hypothetical protein
MPVALSSVMANCTSCNALVEGAQILYTADGRLVCSPCFGKASLALDAELAKEGPGAGLATIGAVAGIVPFFLSITVSHNGDRHDWVAVSGGAIALVFGGLALFGALRAGSRGAAPSRCSSRPRHAPAPCDGTTSQPDLG